MTRLLRALLVVILGWIGFSSTAEAAIAEPVPSIVHAYDYDGMTLPSPEPNLSLSERGPPSRASGHTTHDAVDSWSHDASPRSGRDATLTVYHDNDLAEAVQTAKTRVTFLEVTPGFQRTATRAMRWHVAANTAEKVAVNGETTATKLGRDMHASWDYGPGYTKEFPLRAGGRVDGLNMEARNIFELKPNNPRAIRLGERQIEGYLAKLNEQFPGTPWTGSVVTYGP